MPATVDVSDRDLVRAAQQIRDGGLVAFPTETVYGLGADATHGAAVARIYETKRRPAFNPLIVHVPDAASATTLVVFDAIAHALAAALWPGPLTLVLPARDDNGIAGIVSAGLSTLAVRVPAHPVAQALLQRAQRPVAAPSANRSGRVSPTRSEHVREEFGSDDVLIVDGGPSRSGLESTIVDLCGPVPRLLRPGTITRPQIEAITGSPLASPDPHGPAQQPSAPGQLASHYAPRASVRLNAWQVGPGEALLGFGPDMPPQVHPAVNLSPTSDLREAAANLFDALRALDKPGVTTIAVMPIPDTGIGEAINDRLRRAAAPRP